jgi:uncharacterized membrane protein YukC
MYVVGCYLLKEKIMETIKGFFRKVARGFEIYVCERIALAKGYEKIKTDPEIEAARIESSLDRLEAELDKAIAKGA